MIGFCTRCKQDRGIGCDWGIVMKDGYPTCELCGAFVDIIWRQPDD